MSDVPKIVHDRLRASAPGEPHPEPDVLTAFAEQALSTAERENVVRHLARCGECREVVALSLAPIEAVARPAASGERVGGVPASSGRAGAESRSWFAWPTLRWAALAAGVVVVASVLMLRPGKQPEPTVATFDKQVATAPPAADATAKPKLHSDYRAAPSLEAKAVKPDNPLLREKRAFDMPKKSSPAGSRLQSAPAAIGGVAGNKRVDALGTYQRDAKVPEAPAADARTAFSTSETVGVSGAQPVVSTETAQLAPPAPLEDRLMDRSEALAPIQKAKAPLKEEKSLKAQAGAKEAQGKVAQSFSVAGAALARQSVLSKDVVAQWSFAQGMLRRSRDGGLTWQTALQLEHPLLLGVRGSDVWAGGQGGTLFHSIDNGTTWTQVQPSTKAGTLGADIVGIEIRDPAVVVLTTSNNESWSTADGGKTWEKK